MHRSAFSDSVVIVTPLRLLIKDALLIGCIKDHFLKSGQIKEEVTAPGQ